MANSCDKGVGLDDQRKMRNIKLAGGIKHTNITPDYLLDVMYLPSRELTYQTLEKEHLQKCLGHKRIC